MNAAVLAYGLLKGGPPGARTALHNFWQDVSSTARIYSPFRKLPWEIWMPGGYGLDSSPMYLLTDLMLRVLSPYQFNPFNFNPLREVLAHHVDFAPCDGIAQSSSTCARPMSRPARCACSRARKSV